MGARENQYRADAELQDCCHGSQGRLWLGVGIETRPEINIGVVLSRYVAVDDFQFQFDSEDCGMIPEVASPSPASSTTSAPPLPFPDCQFEEDECGWLKDPVAAMKWERKTKEELDNESLDGPEEAGEGYFMYVGAKEGAAKGTTTLATPMAGAPAAGCLRFQFSLAVSFLPSSSMSTDSNIYRSRNKVGSPT